MSWVRAPSATPTFKLKAQFIRLGFLLFGWTGCGDAFYRYPSSESLRRRPQLHREGHSHSSCQAAEHPVFQNQSLATLQPVETILRKRSLILLLAYACHGLAHAAAPPENADASVKPSKVQRQEDPTVGQETPPSTSATPAQPGAVNPANGAYYPPAGNGDVINPATGERYIGTPGGYITPNTGEFMPKIR